MAKTIMPEMDFNVCEAHEPDETVKFDIVLANSVFNYFMDNEYSETVLKKMYDKAKKKVLILDINDLEMKDESERLRKQKLGEEEFRIKYDGLSHIYFMKNYFEKFAHNLGA
ncbi:MAG: hypothetical protein HC905_16330 [Bacteroidales bacterium]|nr:hypothetical protein [Bacteroidales bacterium]